MRLRSVARVAPIVVLATVVVIAVLTRRRAHPRDAAIAVEPSPAPTRAQPAVSSPGHAATSEDAGATKGARTLHGDARHTHRASARGPSIASVAWQVKLGGAVEAQVVASTDETTLYAASLDGALYALDRGGTIRWKVDLGDRAYATPHVTSDGTILAGSDAKKIFAIAPDGTVRWRLEIGGEVDTGFAELPGGAVAVAAGREVLAIKNGDVVWRFAAKNKIFTAPAVTAEGVVVVGSQDHRVYGLDARTGARVFATDLGADVDGAAAIGDDGAVFVGTDGGEIVRLDARGAIVWRAPVGGFVRGALSVARSGDVLAGVYGPTPRMVRVAPSGEVRSGFAIPGTGAREFGVHGGALEDAAGALYFGAQDDALYALEPDGRLRFRFEAMGDIDAPITLLADGHLVFATDEGTVYALTPRPPRPD